ncbi:MAG TPA: polymer-forming cytoskeletal protein [Thermoanaerobaculia bacterium]
MSTLADVLKRFSGKRAVRALALLLVLGPGAALHAAPAPQSSDRPPATAQERGDLRRTIEARYQVLPVSGGVLLNARQVKAGVRTIEVKGSQIDVNGEAVTARTLRDWLGADADPVLRLLGMTAADQRQLFGLNAEGASPQPAAAPGASTQEPPTSDTDVTETSPEASERPETPEQPEAPEPPDTSKHRESRSSGSRVNVGGSVQIDKDEMADEAVAVGGSVDVQGQVTDQVTAIGGPVRVEGKVGGEVLSVGSSVYLGPHAVVEGDVTSIGGGVHKEPGAVIHGAIHEVGVLPFIGRQRFHRGPIWIGRHWGRWGGVSDLMGNLMGLMLTVLLSWLVVLVARRPLERVDRMLTMQPWQSAAVGLASGVFSLPIFFLVTVLLLISIVGCVLFLLYPFLFLYLGLLLLLAYTAVAYRLGRLLEDRFNRPVGSPYAATLIGVVALQSWGVLGSLFDVLPWPFGVISFMFSLFGMLLFVAAMVVGFGAVVLSRFGLEPGYWPRRGAPPAPPTPPSPPGDEALPLSDPFTNSSPAGWEETGS